MTWEEYFNIHNTIKLYDNLVIKTAINSYAMLPERAFNEVCDRMKIKLNIIDDYNKKREFYNTLSDTDKTILKLRYKHKLNMETVPTYSHLTRRTLYRRLDHINVDEKIYYGL